MDSNIRNPRHKQLQPIINHRNETFPKSHRNPQPPLNQKPALNIEDQEANRCICQTIRLKNIKNYHHLHELSRDSPLKWSDPSQK